MSNLIALTGSLNDVVFEGRNEAYGAFQLRQLYQRHLSSVLAITVAVYSLLLLLPFIFQYFTLDAAASPSVGHVDQTILLQNYVLPKIKLVVSIPA